MPKYIVDVNLPYYFNLWNNENFVHVRDINDEWSDNQIWEYAKENNLIIITKDSDFSNKIILKQPPPRVIHLRFGNLKMNAFHEFLLEKWNEIDKLITKYKLVNVYLDRLEGIE
ncbi:MAG: DUF5615 family PIN-like protein [Bacteroidales bacterium]|nr:DUF5615 family PIN-like protein [Bacteroidales bacterium]